MKHHMREGVFDPLFARDCFSKLRPMKIASTHLLRERTFDTFFFLALHIPAPPNLSRETAYILRQKNTER
jgi:hypothetical protein